ncbi:MAG: TIGR01777 family oxidoreductase [Verrucomicrobia bacterium]|nr:TIGR01777 family oxidoreductase [Verrucomicrobiota bacterium]
MILGLTGASGFLGRELIKTASSQNHTVIGFTRKNATTIPGCQETRIFGPNVDLSNVDAVIHLAGETILGLWTKEKKREIRESRVQGTKWLVDAIEKSRITALIAASGVGIYGDRGEEEITETSSPGTSGFLVDVAKEWERAGAAVESFGTRFVPVRVAMVLGAGGGAMQILAPVFRLGLGGKLGTGKQWMPWIHLADVAALFLLAATCDTIRGPLNAAAPEQVRNQQFTSIFAQVAQRPEIFSVPGPLLSLLLRDQSALLLDSQKIRSAVAEQNNYTFKFPSLKSALVDALRLQKD